MLIQEGEIKFNHQSSLEMNLRLESYPSVPIANEEYEEVAVEGRNGTLIINKGTYKNRVIPFIFTFLSDDIHQNFDVIYEWLTNVKDNRLFYGRTDRVYIVKRVNFGDFEQEFKTFGQFKVEFICEPFKQDANPTNVTLTSQKDVYYLGTQPGDTLFKVCGNGNIQLSVDGETMVINEVSNYVEIDSKLLQVRNQDGTSKDNDTIGNFVQLSYGANRVSWSGNVSKVELEFTNLYR